MTRIVRSLYIPVCYYTLQQPYNITIQSYVDATSSIVIDILVGEDVMGQIPLRRESYDLSLDGLCVAQFIIVQELFTFM